jgi:hypothetical protein
MNGTAAGAPINSVTYAKNLFVAVGYKINGTPCYATSTDGSTWTTPAAMNGTTNLVIMNSITYGNGLFVAIGDTTVTSPTVPVYSVSSDGSTWITPLAMGGTATQSTVNSIAYNNNKFVVVGMLGTAGNPTYATSN